MTVTSAAGSMIVCAWFGKDYVLNQTNFSLSSLKKVRWWTI